MKFKVAGCCIAMLLLLATSAFAQWQFAYQKDLTTSFQAVHFPTASVGYVVGDGGAIYKTIDGGATWNEQTSPTTNTLNDVFFTDATHGFAVGAAGTIIYTTDGTNWSVHAQSGVITTKAIQGVCFVGSDGWIGGGNDNATCEIFKTVDGGTTWANVTVTNPSTDQCTDISFISATRGYASLDGGYGGGPLVMYTTDGGVNWTGSTTNLGPYPYTRVDIECIKAVNDTVAVGSGWGSLVGGQPTIIISTKNGGANFDSDPTYPWATYGYGYNWAKFDNGEVLLVGGGSMSASICVHSTDLGTTFSRLPAFYWDNLNDACALPGTNKVVAVGDQGLIAISSDRGMTWTYTYKPGTFLQGFCDMDGSGPRKVFAAGVGSVFFSLDAITGAVKPGVCSPENWGAEIQDVDWVVNPAAPPSGVWDSTFNDIVYACGKNGYFCKSWDGGQTWVQFDHSNSNFSIYFSMYWFDPQHGIIVGCWDDGANHRKEYIWRTRDGGVTRTPVWSPTFAGTNNEFNSVAFAPDNEAIGIAVGDDNYMVYTADSGNTWTQATENIATSTVDIDECVMINSTTGYGVGEAGTLVKTTDSGHSWQVQTVPWATNLQLWDIDSDTPNRLWVVGPDNRCYYTTDAGTNWTEIDVTGIVSTYDVKSVYYQGPAGILWVGTEYGYIEDRTDQPVTGTDTPALPFALNQNYPNPFNPSTTIEFSIPKDDRVRLNVYDVTGRVVATVMDKNLKAGSHSISFNADKLATGVYFYKLTTSTGEMTRKMVLVR
jgi:photosystem II stability/assembly factor-like uncharacterized protein